MNRLLRRFFVCMLVSIAAGTATAADEPAPAKDSLVTARQHIAAKRWQDAIEELKRVNETGNADWNNLMGYSLRKQGTPDLAASERFYNEALRINPKHRGALEYSGELYLMKGDVPAAEQRLKQLDSACLFSCAEYRDLKKAIENYKAGNKTAATSSTW